MTLAQGAEREEEEVGVGEGKWVEKEGEWIRENLGRGFGGGNLKVRGKLKKVSFVLRISVTFL